MGRLDQVSLATYSSQIGGALKKIDAPVVLGRIADDFPYEFGSTVRLGHE